MGGRTRTTWQEGHPYAHLGAEARQAGREARLEAVLADWPPLDSEANAKRRLEILGTASAHGLLPGTQAGSAVRSIEAWIRVREHELDRARLAELEARLAELEAELAVARGRA